MEEMDFVRDPCNRDHIVIGIGVLVVQKEHQKTGQLTAGFVAEILTSKPYHTRGIKVRLDSGIVGRVQKTLE